MVRSFSRRSRLQTREHSGNRPRYRGRIEHVHHLRVGHHRRPNLAYLCIARCGDLCRSGNQRQPHRNDSLVRHGGRSRRSSGDGGPRSRPRRPRSGTSERRRPRGRGDSVGWRAHRARCNGLAESRNGRHRRSSIRSLGDGMRRGARGFRNRQRLRPPRKPRRPRHQWIRAPGPSQVGAVDCARGDRCLDPQATAPPTHRRQIAAHVREARGPRTRADGNR